MRPLSVGGETIRHARLSVCLTHPRPFAFPALRNVQRYLGRYREGALAASKERTLFCPRCLRWVDPLLDLIVISGLTR